MRTGETEKEVNSELYGLPSTFLDKRRKSAFYSVEKYRVFHSCLDSSTPHQGGCRSRRFAQRS